MVCVRLGGWGELFHRPRCLPAKQVPSRQNSQASISTGKDVAICDGAGMGSIGVGVAVEVKSPPRPLDGLSAI
jgi:hypothetical protein